MRLKLKFFRAFDDDDVTHVEGDVNPVRDLEIIGTELIKKDLQYLEGAIDKLEKQAIRGGDKSKKPEYETLLKVYIFKFLFALNGL